MTEQEQKDKYNPLSATYKVNEAYTGPKKMSGVKDLLDGVEDLVSKDNLADNYKQSSAQ